MSTAGGASGSTTRDSSTPAQPPRAPAFRTWLRATADRVPTGWLTGIFTALFLAVTAAFGSLATAPPAATADVAPGTPVAADGFTVTIHGAIVADEGPSSPAREGYVLLAVEATIVNELTIPIGLGSPLSDVIGAAVDMSGVIRPAAPDSEVAWLELERLDRHQTAPAILQPQLPVLVRAAWYVPSDELSGDEGTVQVWNMQTSQGQSIASERTTFLSASSQAADVTVPLTRQKVLE